MKYKTADERLDNGLCPVCEANLNNNICPKCRWQEIDDDYESD